jgi:hypothetical protein
MKKLCLTIILGFVLIGTQSWASEKFEKAQTRQEAGQRMTQLKSDLQAIANPTSEEKQQIDIKVRVLTDIIGKVDSVMPNLPGNTLDDLNAALKSGEETYNKILKAKMKPPTRGRSGSTITSETFQPPAPNDNNALQGQMRSSASNMAQAVSRRSSSGTIRGGSTLTIPKAQPTKVSDIFKSKKK